MKNVYKFVKDPDYEGEVTSTFTHYWSNSSMNFPDTEDFDSLSEECYLKKNFPNYHWELDNELGINKTNIAYATLTISNWEEPVIFIKFEDDEANEIPSYYFATNPNSQTIASANAVHTVYQLELDLWATVGWRFNTWLKEFNCDILFLRKMCNRFIFNELGDRGYWIDFMKQPWLTRSGYSFNLIRDETEKSLTLEEWLWINSGLSKVLSLDYWLESKWFPWLQNQWSAVFDTTLETPAKTSTITLVPGFYQNLNHDTQANMFNDSAYNSNGKYKWIAIKTGNNTVEYDADGKAKAMKGSVFRKGNKVAIEKGPLSTAYLTIKPEITKGSFTRTNNTYVISSSTAVTYPSDFPVKAIIDFTSELLNKKYIKLNISREDLIKTERTLNQTFFIADHLDKTLRFIENDSFAKNVEYELVSFNSKRIYFRDSKIWVDIQPYITLTLQDSAYLIQFKCEISDIFGGLDYNLSLVESMAFNDIAIYDKTKQPTTVEESKVEEFVFNGEEIMYIPIKKGLDGQRYIQKLNNDANIIFANANVLGMPINDIPPSVLAMAIRSQANSAEMQNYGDIVSTRQAGTNPECPLDIVQLKMTNGFIPVMFNSLNYIPVTMANSPRMNRMYEVIGGTNFFNSFYNLMTNENLTQYNSIYSDPIFLAPQFFQWVYFIDGGNKLVLTPDMIDWYKVVTKSDWTVKLNVNMTDSTHLKLDIGDIKYDLYPFTKSQSELISVDPITHPYSTESFNNYQANNAYTKETSKNAKDIQNSWARRNYPINAIGDFIGSLGSGIGGGAAGGGIWGAIAGGIGGMMGGIAEVITMKAGMENKISMVNQLWDNQWSGMFSNMYSAPASLNPSGFGSGSLIYSDIAKENNGQMELFRTFSILDIYKKLVWDDISINGYGFCSQCKYKEYDNRQVFNILNCNFDDKDGEVNKFLKEKMGELSVVFSQQNFIDWFKLACKSGIRLWKEEFDESSTDELILRNIENDYKLPFKPTAQYVKYEEKPLPIDQIVNDEFDDSYWNNRNNYKWSVSGTTYTLTKATPRTEAISIPYKSLFGEEVVTAEEFIAKFESLVAQYDTSSCEIKSKTSTLAKDVNQALYTLTNINFVSGTTHYEQEVINQVFNSYPFGTILKAINGDNVVKSHKHENGWKISVDLVENFANVTLTEINYFEFTSSVDITSWTIKKQTSSQKVELECPVIKNSPWESTHHFKTNRTLFGGCCTITDSNWNLKEEDRGVLGKFYVVNYNNFKTAWSENAGGLCVNRPKYVLLEKIDQKYFAEGNTVRVQVNIPLSYKLLDWDNIDVTTKSDTEGVYARLPDFRYTITFDATFSLNSEGKITTTSTTYVKGFASDKISDTISIDRKQGDVEVIEDIFVGSTAQIWWEKSSGEKDRWDLCMYVSSCCNAETTNDSHPAAKFFGEDLEHGEWTRRFHFNHFFSFDRTQGSLLDITYNIPTEDLAFEEHNKLNSLIFVKKEV